MLLRSFQDFPHTTHNIGNGSTTTCEISCRTHRQQVTMLHLGEENKIVMQRRSIAVQTQDQG